MSSHHHDHHHDTPEEQLEKSLEKAVKDPAYRTLFYRTLLDSTVYILAESGVQDKGEFIIAPNGELNVQHWEMQDGLSTIPFFSSLKMLQQAVDDEEQPFMALPVRDLFAMTKGAQLFLNPKCEYGKAFYAQEVAMLLQTGGMAQPMEQVVDGGSKILLGQPEAYPSAMVDALTTLFTQRKIVRNAYLAIFQDQAVDEKPNLLIGLEIDGTDEEIDLLIQETGSLASETAPEDEPVDLCLVTDEKGDAVSHYLKTHTQPFYQRRWGSWLRNSIPSSGTA